MYTKFQLYF